ncbi:MAG: outer membrane beta-barrel protein [Bacteroidetes bacterium]|nr:outer membrane beta-barrel protein [Bacteroidota bacterium]
MKKLLNIIGIMSLAVAANAQSNAHIGRWYVGVNGMMGGVWEKMSMRTTGLNYTNAIYNRVPESTSFDNKTSYGGSLQIGFFFDKRREWGIATGVMYATHDGDLSLNNWAVQYQSTDFQNATYRQMITAQGPVKESLKTTNIAIPVVVKYRTQLSKVVGIMIDAGITYSVQTKVDYTGSGTFNYEAAYKYAQTGDGYTTVYDNSPVPDRSDWLITVDQYNRTKGDGGQVAYFNSFKAQGYNVGLNESAGASGTFNYKNGTIGVIFQPQVTFRLSNHIGLQVGGYYMYQNFSNSSDNWNTRLTDKIGTYNSVLNNTIKNQQVSYGGTLGISFMF